MNIETSALRRNPGEVSRSSRFSGPQLSLPLELDARNEDALRAAWKRCGLSMPYHVALQNRPLAICLSCLADAMQKKACLDAFGADVKRGSRRRRK